MQKGVVKLAGMSATVTLVTGLLFGCGDMSSHGNRWHERYSFVNQVQPITFHYYHGILAGSYPEGREVIDVEFDDVCAQLGHVCLCGAGGFRISGEAVEALGSSGDPLERGSFILISGRDHTVSDVVAFVLGCARRDDPEYSQYFVDDTIKTARREYLYYIGCPATRAAARILYKKHLLIGNEKMDQLWQIELAYDENPSGVSQDDIERYSTTMKSMVYDVLFDRVPGLLTVETIPYEEFSERLEKLHGDHDASHIHDHH